MSALQSTSSLNPIIKRLENSINGPTNGVQPVNNDRNAANVNK